MAAIRFDKYIILYCAVNLAACIATKFMTNVYGGLMCILSLAFPCNSIQYINANKHVRVKRSENTKTTDTSKLNSIEIN